MSQKIFFRVFLCALFVFTTLKAQELNPPSDDLFNQTLASWLATKNLKGKVLDSQRVYDEDGFIESMRLVFQENQPKGERTQPTFDLELSQDAASETLQVTILGKDLNSIVNLKYDWMAEIVVRYALNKISDYLGLKLHIAEKNGIHTATLLPSSFSEASRYRFEEIVVNYSISNLIINIGVSLKGPQDYLIAEYAKSQVNANIRALEQGEFPGSYTGGPIIGPTTYPVLNDSFDSSSVIREFLELGGVYRSMPPQENP